MSQETPLIEEKSNNIIPLVVTGILAIIYFVFSTFSDGFYQHDEAGHFIHMRGFWEDPFSILGVSQKPGYKLLYVIPALGGLTIVKMFNSIVAAFTVYFAYKTAEKLKLNNPILIFFMFGLLPLWFMLSFRNFSEIPSAFLLSFGAYMHFSNKKILAALALSYVTFIRQEYYPIIGLYGLFLLYKKQWLPAILLGTFTVVHNLYGFLSTGDLLYLPHQMMEYSEKIKDAWPKQGFDHYLLMSNVIFGAVVLTLFVVYIAAVIINKKKPNWFLLVPVVGIILLNCLLNAQSIDFGPGNGGNLRYLIILSPLISLLALSALTYVQEIKKKYLMLLVLLPFLILVAVYQTYEHNFVKFTEVVDWKPFIFSLLAIVFVLLPLKTKHYLYAFSALSIIVAIVNIETFKATPEDESMKKAANWYKLQINMSNNPQQANKQIFNENARLASQHPLFLYYLGKNKYEFNEPVLPVIEESLQKLKKGDILIWDSHYSYRPKLRPTSKPYDFYEKSPDYQRIQYYRSKDNRFTVVFFQKITD